MLSLTNLIGFGGTGVTGGTPASLGFFAWGDNTEGQTGNGDTGINPLLVPTNTDATSDIFIPSSSYTYALHMGFLINNDLWMTGDNQYGQLGLGDENDRDVFTDVFSNGSNITDFALGASHTLTIRNGKVNGCGRNNRNQLTSDEPGQTNIFSILITSADAVKVYASQFSSAVFTGDNEVFTWGAQVGATPGSSNAQPFNIRDFNTTGFTTLEGRTIVDFAIGTTHCIVTTQDGLLFTTADSAPYGQTGNGIVATGLQEMERILLGGEPSKISCGAENSYVIFDGLLFGCGRGDGGQLGAATTASANSTFIELDPSITDWIDVKGGDGYVIAKRQDGSLHHTGDKSFAQDGNGTAGGTNLGFVQITGPPDQVYGNFVATRRTVFGLVG